MIAAGCVALILAVAAGWLALAPAGDGSAGLPARVLPAGALPSAAPIASEPAASTAPAGGPIVVDVQGAVVEPGIRELPGGSRLAEAIAAAGGYASDADLAAAAASINLAQTMADGEQIHVPRIGEAEVAAGDAPPSGAPAPAGGSGGATGGSGGATGGGAVDLNTATPEQLEALPGIGPVTVQKIVAARTEQPFASLDDAVQRGVIDRGQLEDIQGLATAG